ncbi:hypothetical protein L6452_30890 [Arctium lappa]|uniref:Uncharacterized protein n=1 Tax=Arctium lappa TaxID=4217 RepID=A0ACB8ZJM0_ARCLA|nr:hypothetical protein L6452_30890 [Arctium lappa]
MSHDTNKIHPIKNSCWSIREVKKGGEDCRWGLVDRQLLAAKTCSVKPGQQRPIAESRIKIGKEKERKKSKNVCCVWGGGGDPVVGGRERNFLQFSGRETTGRESKLLSPPLSEKMVEERFL